MGDDVFCVCRTTDIDRFMIGCDKCDEWFHGDCIGITEREAASMAKFFCDNCCEKYKLKIEYDGDRRARDVLFSQPLKRRKIDKERVKEKEREKERMRESKEPRERKEKEKEPHPTTSQPPLVPAMTRESKSAEAVTSRPHVPSSGGCGQCIGCFQTEDCGKCETCSAGKKALCEKRRCVQLGQNSSKKREGDVELLAKKTDGLKLKHVSRQQNKAKRFKKVADAPDPKLLQDLVQGFSRTRSSRKSQVEFMREAGILPEGAEDMELIIMDDDEEDEDEARQCLGPGCCHAARPLSKYCSDACGLKLATLRIQDLLPERYAAYFGNGGPAATKHSQTRLQEMALEKMKAKEALEALDAQEAKLKEWLQQASRHPICEDADSADSESEQTEVETSIACSTCGHEVSAKNAIRHMSRCFSKYESQTSYGSAHKTADNVYNLFCDAYNSRNGTYCKRLRVICPEHSKDTKVSGEEICGCPLSQGMKMSDPSQLCRLPKGRCRRHYRWDRIQFALIAINRLNQLLRLDELWEEERLIDESAKERGNVLGLLLHETIKH